MFEYLEMYKTDPSFKWIELRAGDTNHTEPGLVRLAVDDDYKKMARTFIERYQAKQQEQVEVPEAQHHVLEELCEEAAMARVLCLQGKASPDLLELLPTTVVHFKYPEKSSFRKSRAARIKLFTEEALDALDERNFELAMQRLDWVHLLDSRNEVAFQWKVVCLRSWKKMAECVPVFENWIAAHATSTEARLGLSEMWLYLGQNQRAIDQFEEILIIDDNNIMAIIGIAQAHIRLGEDPITLLRKAWMKNPRYTVEMVEHQLDFRTTNATDLRPGTLKDVATAFKIPLARVLERAERGVLPMHPPDESQLLRFSEAELKLHYAVLKCVGLEIQTGELKPFIGEGAAVQQNLFEDDEFGHLI